MASAGSGSYRHCRFDSWHDKVTLPSWRVGSVAFASQPASTVSGKDAHSRNCSGAEKTLTAVSAVHLRWWAVVG